MMEKPKAPQFEKADELILYLIELLKANANYIVKYKTSYTAEDQIRFFEIIIPQEDHFIEVQKVGS